ncbi:MAG: hypothetical protein RIC35_16070 [Marinoscillum sp.]
MKIQLIFLVLCICFSCKVKSSKQADKLNSPEIKQSQINPDECLIHGVILSADSSSAQIVISHVKERGFSFKQNIRAGDTIKVVGKITNSTESESFVLEYVNQPGGGYYSFINQ